MNTVYPSTPLRSFLANLVSFYPLESTYLLPLVVPSDILNIYGGVSPSLRRPLFACQLMRGVSLLLPLAKSLVIRGFFANCSHNREWKRSEAPPSSYSSLFFHTQEHASPSEGKDTPFPKGAPCGRPPTSFRPFPFVSLSSFFGLRLFFPARPTSVFLGVSFPISQSLPEGPPDPSVDFHPSS